MVRKIYYASETKYIPNSGGRLVFTLTGYTEDGDSIERVNFTRVFSEKNNFDVMSMVQSGDFEVTVVLNVRNLNAIAWENQKDYQNQQLRISYNFIDILGDVAQDSFTIPFVGDYNYFLNNFNQPQIGGKKNGVSKVTLFSYEALTTNTNIKYAIVPRVASPLPMGIDVSIRQLGVDYIAKIAPYEITITVAGDISTYSGVVYDSSENVYRLPINIEQYELANNPRDKDFDTTKAKQATYLVKFNPV